MPAARYWRAVGFRPYSGDALELSELHLYAVGARVDAAAAITCPLTPSSGSLSALQDNSTATVCRWASATANGFALVWDFGAPQSVDAVRLGAGASNAEYPAHMTLQYSADAITWETLGDFGRFLWPGAGALDTPPTAGDNYFSSVALLLHMEGTTSTVDTSATPKTVTLNPGATLDAGGAAFGAKGLKPSSGGISVPSHADFNIGTGAFTFECWFYVLSWSPSLASLFNIGSFGNGALFRVQQNTVELWINGTVMNITASISSGAWHHIAWARSGGVVSVYLDGVSIGSSSFAGSIPSGNLLVGVSAHNGGEYINGFIDELRLTNGVARYAAGFTPPVAPFPDTGGGQAFGAAIPQALPLERGAEISGGSAAPPSLIIAPGAAQVFDLEDFGPYRIAGTVKEKSTPSNMPLRRRVQLYAQRSGRLVREAWSDADTGEYSFDHIRGDLAYFVVSFDHTGFYRAVIADNLTPTAM